MIADIPHLFSDIVDGKPAIPQELSWATEKDTEFYMQWYGKPVKIVSGKTYRWDGQWIECEERKDVLYSDARNCSDSVTIFHDEETNRLADGYYWLVGDFADNPYGFRMPMLIPADFYKVLFDKPVTSEGFKEYFMYQPNVFGVVLKNKGRWAHVNGTTVGLDFQYQDGKAMSVVQEANGEKPA